MKIKSRLRNVLTAVAFITLSMPRIGHSNEPTTHRIEISQFRFVPDNLSVQPGDTIIWTNRDVVPHKVTATDESWDTGALKTPTTHRIEISQFRFVPDNLSVQPGDTIIWTNRDVVPHKVTATDESWDTGALKTGESGSVVVSEDFNLRYFCPYHPTMKAELENG